MRHSSNRREQTMGRRPIHEQAMSATERQRRRRARLRAEPWRDQRLAVRAILLALRDLQGESEAQLSAELLARICDRAVANMGLEDEAQMKEARDMVAKLLDPNEPLPERGRRTESRENSPGCRPVGRARRSFGSAPPGRSAPAPRG